MSRSSIDLRDLDQERFEKFNHTDSAPSLQYDKHGNFPANDNNALIDKHPFNLLQLPKTEDIFTCPDQYDDQLDFGGRNQPQTLNNLTVNNSNNPLFFPKSNKQYLDFPVIPIEEDKRELKRFIEDSFIYFKNQTNNSNGNIHNVTDRCSTVSELVVANYNSEQTGCEKRILALSDSEFFITFSKNRKDQNILKKKSCSNGIGLGVTVFKNLITKSVRSEENSSIDNEKYNVEDINVVANKNREQHMSDCGFIKSSVFRRSKSKKLSRSYNGVNDNKVSGDKSNKKLNESNSNESVVRLQRMMSEGHNSSKRNKTDYTLVTPDILLDLYKTEAKPTSKDIELINFNCNIMPLHLSPTNQQSSLIGSCGDIIVFGNTTDESFLEKELSPKLDLNITLNNIEDRQNEDHINTENYDSTSLRKSKCIISPPTSSNSFSEDLVNTSSLNYANLKLDTNLIEDKGQEFFLLPIKRGNHVFSDSSTISLDIITTTSSQSIKGIRKPIIKPEIILDSTLSPSLSIKHEQKESIPQVQPINQKTDFISSTDMKLAPTNNAYRKRQTSVTYDVNVIDFTNDASDSRSYIPMGRASTSSASE